MDKLNKKVLTSSLVIMLSIGLAGCATNSATSTHEANEVTNTKVAQKRPKAVKEEHKANNAQQYPGQAKRNSAAATNTNFHKSSQGTIAAPVISSSIAAHSSSATAASTKSNMTKPSTVANNNMTANKTTNEHQIVQLGLSDTASWTDDKGITHHVDSDGMDRQTITGNDQVHYQDWSGRLPQNAVVTHSIN